MSDDFGRKLETLLEDHRITNRDAVMATAMNKGFRLGWSAGFVYALEALEFDGYAPEELRVVVKALCHWDGTAGSEKVREQFQLFDRPPKEIVPPLGADRRIPDSALCSWCRKAKSEVWRLIPGRRGVNICNECVEACQSWLNDDPEAGR